jgi:protein-disulfide isomerase
LGNASGDVTLVEFFDYNCGFCKRALGDLVNLLAEDAKLKVVLKEFPVLGQRSMDAALVAVAVRMQEPSGVKYLAFHRQLLGSREAVNRERALAAASELGLDRIRLERDMASEEAHATIAENEQLAAAFHISGTPAYVVGANVFTGAIGEHALKEQIDAVRNNPNQ